MLQSACKQWHLLLPFCCQACVAWGKKYMLLCPSIHFLLLNSCNKAPAGFHLTEHLVAHCKLPLRLSLRPSTARYFTNKQACGADCVPGTDWDTAHAGPLILLLRTRCHSMIVYLNFHTICFDHVPLPQLLLIPSPPHPTNHAHSSFVFLHLCLFLSLALSFYLFLYLLNYENQNKHANKKSQNETKPHKKKKKWSLHYVGQLLLGCNAYWYSIGTN